MKKALMEGVALGADTKTSLSLVIYIYNKICCPSLLCYAPGAEIFLWKAENYFASPLLLKIESVSDEKNPGQASDFTN